MGNCCRHESSTEWGGEEWGSPLSQKMTSLYNKGNRDSSPERVSLLRQEEKNASSSSSSTTEVKIKITKKQLEELLGQVDVQGLTVEQLLKQLINARDDYRAKHHRGWKPALQSIPEVD